MSSSNMALRDGVESLARSEALRRALAALARDEEWLTERHLEFTRIAAPTFQEQARAEYFRRQFEQEALEEVRVDEAGNVLAEIAGTAPPDERRVVALTAHLDTVFPGAPAPEVRRENGLLYGPGVTDNGAGLAAMLGVARAARQGGCRARDTLLFVANVGEEGEGNLRGMRHLLAGEWLRSRLRGLFVLDGAGTDHIIVRALGSRRLEIIVEGPGGHSWTDFGLANPIHALATAVTRLVSRPFAAGPAGRDTCNIGEFRGGTSVNSIPFAAAIKVDIRSGSPDRIAPMAAAVEETVRAAVDEENQRASRGRLTYRRREIGERPAAELSENARILKVTREVDAFLGIRSRLESASTDANLALALGLEAVALGGGGQGGGAHSCAEWYDPARRPLGLKRILLAALLLAGAAEAGPVGD